MRPGLVLALLLAASACVAASDSIDNDATWVGTITTEGNVTTVVNESGSVWGGTARLVEEATIGVETGADEYMLGEIAALHATDDEIYVLDNSASKVRVYDFAGNHLRSFGRGGQGPGEFGRFAFGLNVAPDGRVYVGDVANRRISIHSPEGEAIDEIAFSSQVQCCSAGLVLADGGGVWLQVRVDDGGPSSRAGVRVHTVDGPVGEPILVPEIEYERRVIRTARGDIERVPFAARLVWGLGYDQSLIVGASDRYRFRIIHPGGRRTVVERFWDPVPITAEQADYWRRAMLADFGRAMDLSWNGENIPDHKPAYRAFLSAASGEIWLMREGPLLPDACTLPPEQMVQASDPADYLRCLFGELTFDVFDRDGRYLGNVEGLSMVSAQPFINNDTVVAVAQDDAGTIMVKRYRLVVPN